MVNSLGGRLPRRNPGLESVELEDQHTCARNAWDLPIIVFDLSMPGNIARVVRGESIGTVVTNG